IFRLFADINNAVTPLAHSLHHPYEIVSVRVDDVGEVEAAAPALRAGDDEQIGKTAGMQAEKSPGSFGFPLVRKSTAAATLNPIEGGGSHPLKSGRVDQYVERIFDAFMDDAALVDLAYAARGGVDQMDVWQIEGRQILIVEGRPFASIRVVGLQCCRC